MAALEREYAEMRAAEAEAAAGLRERAAKERQKALAVQAQQALWQRGLELRILLQRALQGANRLPQVGARWACWAHAGQGRQWWSEALRLGLAALGCTDSTLAVFQNTVAGCRRHRLKLTRNS